MADATHRLVLTGSGPDALVPTRILTGEGTSQTAYRRWLDHCDGCITCRDGVDPTGQSKPIRCQAGTVLWQDYRDARIMPLAAQ